MDELELIAPNDSKLLKGDAGKGMNDAKGLSNSKAQSFLWKMLIKD